MQIDIPTVFAVLDLLIKVDKIIAIKQQDNPKINNKVMIIKELI